VARRNERLISEWVTTQDLARLFNVIPLSVHNWRFKRKLPYIRIKGSNGIRSDAIMFDLPRVMLWADQEDETFSRNVLRELKARIVSVAPVRKNEQHRKQHLVGVGNAED